MNTYYKVIYEVSNKPIVDNNGVRMSLHETVAHAVYFSSLSYLEKITPTEKRLDPRWDLFEEFGRRFLGPYVLLSSYEQVVAEEPFCEPYRATADFALKHLFDNLPKPAVLSEEPKSNPESQTAFEEEYVPPSDFMEWQSSEQVGGTHYKMVIEPVTFIEANEIPFSEGNVIKYVARHQVLPKAAAIKSLQKAMNYLKRILKARYGVE